MKPGLFFDRDGTIIEHVDFLRDPNMIHFLPGAIPALRAAREAGLALVMISNQSGIGRGLVTIDELNRVNSVLENRLAEGGVVMDSNLFSPDAPGPSFTRKPSPYLVFCAAREIKIDLKRSFFVGDREVDLQCGWNAGLRASILVKTGFGAALAADPRIADGPALIANDFSAAVALVLQNLGDDVGGVPGGPGNELICGAS